MSGWWETFYDRDIAETLLSGPREGELDFLVRELGLKPGDRVFDQCCGWGRIAGPLLEAGYQVEGVDGAPELLQMARQQFPQGRFELADAGVYLPPELCDGACNLYSSFGCSVDQNENLACLARLAESLKPGGRAILDTINPGRVLSGFRDLMTTEYPDGSTITRRSWLDWEKGLLHQEWSLQRPGGSPQNRQGHTRLTFPHTLAEMLQSVGLQPLHLYGDLQSAPFELTSERLIWVAVKP